jgi:lysyl-tRNA synthetase class I
VRQALLSYLISAPPSFDMLLSRKEQMECHSCEVLIYLCAKILPVRHIYFAFMQKTIDEFDLVVLCTNYRV